MNSDLDSFCGHAERNCARAAQIIFPARDDQFSRTKLWDSRNTFISLGAARLLRLATGSLREHCFNVSADSSYRHQFSPRALIRPERSPRRKSQTYWGNAPASRLSIAVKLIISPLTLAKRFNVREYGHIPEHRPDYISGIIPPARLRKCGIRSSFK